jgi:outer membrane protein assembly factor BamB
MRSKMASLVILLSLLVLAGCGNAVRTATPTPVVPTPSPTLSGPPPLSLYFSAPMPAASPASTPATTQQSTVSALDASTGKLRWTYTAGSQVQSVPVVAQDTLYVGADDQAVYALNIGNGSVRWKASLEGEPEVITVQDGVVYGDIVLITSGHATRGPIFALSASDGALLWRSDVSGAFYGLIDGVVYVVTSDNQLYTLDAGKGTMRWQFQMNYQFNGLKVAQGLVFLFASQRANGTPNVVLSVLDVSTGKLQWSYPAQKDTENLSLVGVENGVLYLVSSVQQNLASMPLVLALDASDGALLWQYQASNPSTSFTSSTLDQGVLYLGTNAGLLFALRATNGSVRWQTKPTSTMMNFDLIDNGALYVTVSTQGVTAINLSDGSVRWRYQSADYVGISSVRNGVLYGFSVSSSFGPNSHNYILALRASDGALLWRYDAGASSIFPVLS